MHAPLEVAVAREDRRGDEAVVFDRGCDLLSERPGVSDAGGAAETHEVEPQRVE